MEIYIYTLSHPITKEVRYVGKTNNCRKRLANHLYTAGKIKRYSCNWIKSLLNKGLIPIMDVIEICNEDTWVEREIFWIAQHHNLTNHTLGGEGGLGGNPSNKVSDEALIKVINLLGTKSDRDIERELKLSKGFICRARTGRVKYINEMDIVIPDSMHPKGNGGATKGMKLKLTKSRRKNKTLTYLKDRNKWRIMHYVEDKRKVFGMYNTKEEALSNM